LTLDTLLHPYSLILLASFAMGIIGPHFYGRRKMMAFKFGGDSLAGLYLFLMGGTAGACGAGIAATGALIQSLTPNTVLKKTVWPRMAFAIFLSIAAIFLIYHRPSDIIPIAMVIICRFGELQSKAQRIRIVYFFTGFPWLAYHYINDLYLPIITTSIGILSLLISIIKHHIRQSRMPQDMIE